MSFRVASVSVCDDALTRLRLRRVNTEVLREGLPTTAIYHIYTYMVLGYISLPLSSSTLRFDYLLYRH